MSAYLPLRYQVLKPRELKSLGRLQPCRRHIRRLSILSTNIQIVVRSYQAPHDLGTATALAKIQLSTLTCTQVGDGFVMTSWSAMPGISISISTHCARESSSYALPPFPLQGTKKGKAVTTEYSSSLATTHGVLLQGSLHPPQDRLG